MKEKDYMMSTFIKICVLGVLCCVLMIVHDRASVLNYSTASVIPGSESSSGAEVVQGVQQSFAEDRVIEGTVISGITVSGSSKVDADGIGKTTADRNHKKVGWIRIPGIVVNYPIMFAKDDENYYLQHSSKNKKSANGAVFLETKSEGFWSTINLIHGHNLRSGAIFGELDKYRSQAWANKHKSIYVTEDDGVEYKYTIFSVLTIDSRKETVQIECESDNEYADYYKELAERSKFKMGDPTDAKRVVILNTCAYDFRGQHLLVAAFRK